MSTLDQSFGIPAAVGRDGENIVAAVLPRGEKEARPVVRPQAEYVVVAERQTRQRLIGDTASPDVTRGTFANVD